MKKLRGNNEDIGQSGDNCVTSCFPYIKEKIFCSKESDFFFHKQ